MPATEFLYFSLTFVQGKTCPKGREIFRIQKQTACQLHKFIGKPITIINFS